MAKYIQNAHIANVKCKIEEKGGQLAAGRPTSREFIFRPYSADRRDGRQGESGYTELTDDEYKMLTENSKLFNHSVEKRLLIVHDELPAEAQTPYDTIVAARRENAALRARITELEAEIGANVDPKAKKALVDAQEEIEALRGSKEATDKAYAALEALVAAIDPEVIAKARESVAATQF